jgi:hypothetical protein
VMTIFLIFVVLQVSPLTDIDKLLDCEMRPTVEGDDDDDTTKSGSKQIFVKQYLVKWKGLSYLHCTWYICWNSSFILLCLSIAFIWPSIFIMY